MATTSSTQDLHHEALLLLASRSPAIDDGVHAGHEEQGEERGHEQAADDGATQRRILGIARRHGHHPDNHGRGGHEHRTEAGLPGFDRGPQRVAVLLEPFARIGDDEDRIGGRRAHAS